MGGSAARGGLDSVDVRDGEKGPLIVEIVKRRVVGRAPQGQVGHAKSWW
jgi:hypothetical protein